MISRRILAAVALLCAIAPAHAQKTKSVVISEINANFPDQTTGAITPAIARTTFTDFVNSWQQFANVNPQAGTTYTVQLSDYGQLITFNNGSSVAVTLPQAAGSFTTFNFFAQNNGSGTVTITPTTSTIGGATSFALATGQSAFIISDGTNYQVIRTGLSATQFSAGNCITITGTTTPTVAVAGSGCITTSLISNNNVTNALLAQMAGSTIKGNVLSNTTANAQDLTPGQVGSILCTPIRTLLTSGTTQVLTPTTCNGIPPTWLEVDVQGGGAGGGGSGTTVVAGNAGNASSFGTLTAGGGGAPAGASVVPGAGGTCSGSLGTQQNFIGSSAGSVINIAANSFIGGMGGVSFYGGVGAPNLTGSAGIAAPANSGGGGSGGSGNATAGVIAAAGGGAGCHIRTIIVSPLAASYTYTVGAAVSGGNAGAGPGLAGGGGAAGLIDVIQHWQ